ncbi:bifunctional diaminohydroxyphosphoribosylaminopyrimidine deaminase/5-amino-6-(5-phosphoribosylamino)uracil reductase RibD [Gammaproteobacteria bacterium]|nr:bifunctional diaminohydroxyphosphoribosylaminopyrimidine deaminase/5-amino-6-(5-phosphoribosylamino)uracil reductase RibD [Gammaproteobacteria bacterium]
MPASDISYMQRCIALAKKGQGIIKSGALVGCVIVKNDEVIAEGWYQTFGQAHAEINALNSAGEKAGGATLYVSLEPCAHWGKTGPCCEAIIAAGIVRVVFGMLDPNPKVKGKGLEKIKAAGIDVSGPVLESECAELNPGFVKRMTAGLPFLRCKLAMSLDGRTAMSSGESKWITGKEAREDVQKLRAASSALITGVETILIDDPSLNVRMAGSESSQPLRVIVDSQLRTPQHAKSLQVPGEILLATALENRAMEYSSPQVQIKSFPDQNNQVNLPALMEYLAQEYECNEVLLESGPTLAGAMLKAGLIDEIITYIAPTLLGSTARPLFNLPGMENMSEQIGLEIIDVAIVGKDCRMRTRVIKS